ncbi:acetate kinase [Marinihelvus fidelis]|uniref:Acetate kinase n=1 Tax=Marinihelvus fidelis TaxID=2613842 RepID=A0A5N0T9F7_9GAMM|nr:acetate kinase [Marinihelvus fidelis]KAA9131582.1 acetate kinase [Marinihelvus fidelis]
MAASTPAHHVLVLNAGSSSIKYVVFDAGDLSERARGQVERIGEPGGEAGNHRQALALIVDELGKAGIDGNDLVAVGHRVVHGGEAFTAPTRVNDDALQTIRDLASLAPLHNPANADGIEVARHAFPGIPHVAVFDTAFHATMPAHAYRYAVPEAVYREHGVRRYGFHGTSHQYVTGETARRLGCPVDQVNLVSLHLGNGASACAVRGGRSIDTSMGMTPLAGLVMGTRPGDIDPGVLLHLATSAGYSADDLSALLNRESGLKGLCGAGDMREVLRRSASGDEAAELAVRKFCYQAAKQVGAYAAALGRVDALVFTAGIGENNPEIRAGICAELCALGIHVDPKRNAAPQDNGFAIHASGSKIVVYVIPTREEFEIARQTLTFVEDTGSFVTP